MASRSMFMINNQFDNSNLSKYNLDKYFVHNSCLILDSLTNSIDYNNSLSILSPITEFNDKVVGHISNFFVLIDLSNFLIQSIKQEDEKIKILSVLDSKIQLNYHKIKEIDFMKCLVLINERIECLIQNDLCVFSKEVHLRHEELKMILGDNLLSNIGEATENFTLSCSAIENILDDCNTDLEDLDRAISEISRDWNKKRHRGRINDNRSERLSKKTINTLECDIMKQLATINVILDRLLNGYSHNILNFRYLIVAQDLLLEFHSEIDERQYQNIVFLKHFQWELEQKSLSQILEIKESQIVPNLTERDQMFNCRLSPIRTVDKYPQAPSTRNPKSMAISTPYIAQRVHHKSTGHDDLFCEYDDRSILSQDSGILPTSENNLLIGASLETLDIIPFPEEEYEKIIDLESEKDELSQQDDSDCFGSMSTGSRRDSQKSESVICYTPDNRESSLARGTSGEVPFYSASNMNFLENYEAIVDNLAISSKQKLEMKNKLKVLLSSRNTTARFNCALKMTIYRYKENPFDDLSVSLEHLERVFFSFMNIDIREIASKSSWISNVDNQNNNSACCANFVGQFNSNILNQSDQNTNNNADAKDDESSDLNSSPNDLTNKLSMCTDTDLQLPVTNSIADSSSTDFIDETDHDEDININCDKYSTGRYNITALSEHSHSNLLEDDTDKSLPMTIDPCEGSLLLEDIDLALRLSELHLRSEYESELRAKEALLESRDRVIGQYKVIVEETGTRITQVKTAPESGEELSNDEWKDYVNQLYDTVDDVEEVVSSEEVIDYSMDRSEATDSQSPTRDIDHDDESLSTAQRINLTISLTKRLLDVTTRRLHFIASIVKNKDVGKKPKILSNRMFSIYSSRERLSITSAVISNMKYSITCSNCTERNSDIIPQLDKIITDCDNLSKFSYSLEEWFNKAGLTIDEINSDYLEQLPDDLLVSLDPYEMDTILSISIQRLHVTISALTDYPCYESLMKSSLKKFVGHSDPIKPIKTETKSPLSNSDLIREIHKLRRITAVCALNIVDLHVIIAHADEKPDLEDKRPELKELLLVWRVIDKECHRLLRCNSLIQHVLMDTRRTYVELVSLTAVMVSIMRTIDMSEPERSALKEHIDNVHSYKCKIIDWLDEVELCSSVVHRKRITNKRFKFYEDIHNYLEENLKSISELANHINLGCRESVKSLTKILTYCTSLSSRSLTEIDGTLKSNNVIDNRHFNASSCDKFFTNECIVSAVLHLELTEQNVARLQEMLDQSKELFLVIIGDRSCVVQDQTVGDAVVPQSDVSALERAEREANVVENAMVKVTEKISAIATYAAGKAILLFVDKSCIEDQTDDAAVDFELNGLKMITESEETLNVAVEAIVDEITSMMTARLVQNIDSKFSESSRLIFNDVCHQLCDRVVTILVDALQLDITNIGDGNAISVYGKDLFEYISLQDLSMIESPTLSPPCIASCVTKLQKKMSQRLFDKSVLYIADFVGACIDSDCDISKDVKDNFQDFPSPIPTYRLSKKVPNDFIDPYDISSEIAKMLEAAPISFGEYHCDIRRPLPKRITSDRISKLVARFDRGILEEELSMNAPMRDIGTVKSSSGSIQIQWDEVRRELICDGTEDSSMENKTAENLSLRGFESCSSLDKVVKERVISSGILRKSYSTETRCVDIVEFGTSSNPFPQNIVTKGKNVLQDSVNKERIDSLCTHVSSISESIKTAEMLGNCNVTINISENQLTTTVCSDPLTQSCHSLKTQIHSPLILKLSDQLANRGDETAPISQDSDVDDTTPSHNDLSLEALVTDSNPIGSHMLTSPKVVKQINVSENETVIHVPLKRFSTQITYDSQNLKRDYAFPYAEEKVTNSGFRQSDYEASLSKLWVWIFGIVLLGIMGLLFHDYICRACCCAGRVLGRVLLPRVVSKGLPF